MNLFRKISEIDCSDESTWKGKLFLTFDIDWAHDDVLTDTINLVEKADIAATWFVTHDTPILDRLRENPLFELGTHPNFNFLLEGDHRNGSNSREVVEKLLEIVPEASSVRSHSMAHNSVLLNLFSKLNITHDANLYIPSGAYLTVKPWKLWNKITRVPHIWEDDLFCLYENSDQTEREPKEIISNSKYRNESLIVFDFHPIHIFLNTENMQRYEKTRSLHRTPNALINHQFSGYGTRNRLLDLIKNK